MVRRKPQVDTLHVGANYGSLSKSDLDDVSHTLEEAETDARQKGYINAPHELTLFRKGWFVGIANREIEEFQWMIKRLKREEIQHLGEILAEINRRLKAGEYIDLL